MKKYVIQLNHGIDEDEYEIQAEKLAEMFIINYQKYIDPNFTDYSKYGPNI